LDVIDKWRKKMKRLLAASVLVLSVMAGNAVASDRVITTTGTGVAEAVPDMARIDIGVTHQAGTAGEALSRTSEALSAVLKRLQDAGIEARDMQTQGLSLQPVWSRDVSGSDGPRRITGFVARNNLMVRIRDLSALGGILDIVVRDGANSFNGLQFSVQDPEPLMAQARAEAVEEAMRKAQQLAEAAGVTLGPVQSISEQGGVPRPVMMEMAASRMAADVPVATGEISLSTNVNMVFSIVE
jgi:uncharacterized protein YggE